MVREDVHRCYSPESLWQDTDLGVQIVPKYSPTLPVAAAGRIPLILTVLRIISIQKSLRLLDQSDETLGARLLAQHWYPADILNRKLEIAVAFGRGEGVGTSRGHLHQRARTSGLVASYFHRIGRRFQLLREALRSYKRLPAANRLLNRSCATLRRAEACPARLAYLEESLRRPSSPPLKEVFFRVCLGETTKKLASHFSILIGMLAYAARHALGVPARGTRAGNASAERPRTDDAAVRILRVTNGVI
ncbi:uncharacterized protein B0H18DRAFT_1103553 [Fomitopsis serialis]|uniref:uncharacterized protein n=1 Tax=Fomitopsis serialis TaxID=139415 RepID=UPI0020083E0B|nr:uncharacterized protein B0H18DRAFT_1103553 [Neoantrodia serialis]KAH9929234.1 hypothetical protein B0H18DRAFT_1103553 [Neoantrodia serialis]